MGLYEEDLKIFQAVCAIHDSDAVNRFRFFTQNEMLHGRDLTGTIRTAGFTLWNGPGQVPKSSPFLYQVRFLREGEYDISLVCRLEEGTKIGRLLLDGLLQEAAWQQVYHKAKFGHPASISLNLPFRLRPKAMALDKRLVAFVHQTAHLVDNAVLHAERGGLPTRMFERIDQSGFKAYHNEAAAKLSKRNSEWACYVGPQEGIIWQEYRAKGYIALHRVGTMADHRWATHRLHISIGAFYVNVGDFVWAFSDSKTVAGVGIVSGGFDGLAEPGSYACYSVRWLPNVSAMLPSSVPPLNIPFSYFPYGEQMCVAHVGLNTTLDKALSHPDSSLIATLSASTEGHYEQDSAVLDSKEALIGSSGVEASSAEQLIPQFEVPSSDDDVTAWSETEEWETFIEDGASRLHYGPRYERNRKLRNRALEIHGVRCQACGFDFEKVYGPLGHGFAHVHHLTPISKTGGVKDVNPRSDMAVLCANCHAMVHRQPGTLISVAELRELIKASRSASRLT